MTLKETLENSYYLSIIEYLLFYSTLSIMTSSATQNQGSSSRGIGKIVLILIWIILLWGRYVMWIYNGLLSSDESIKSKQAQVENMYERRADLVPQVTAVVKKYAEYERWVLTGIAGLRSNATALENMAKQGDVKSEAFGTLLASTLGGMKIISENYPTLKADTQFTNLYTTLEGSENRIRTAIMDYNDAIVPYNTKVRTFPTNLVANFLNMGAKDRITPTEGKDIKAVPNVEWLLN